MNYTGSGKTGKIKIADIKVVIVSTLSVKVR